MFLTDCIANIHRAHFKTFSMSKKQLIGANFLLWKCAPSYHLQHSWKTVLLKQKHYLTPARLHETWSVWEPSLEWTAWATVLWIIAPFSSVTTHHHWERGEEVKHSSYWKAQKQVIFAISGGILFCLQRLAAVNRYCQIKQKIRLV